MVVKRTPWGCVYTQYAGGRLWLRVEGKRISTGLRNTPAGVVAAMQMGDAIWHTRHVPSLPAPTGKVTMLEAHARFMEDHAVGKAPRTQKLYRAAFRCVAGDGREHMTTDNAARLMRVYAAKSHLAIDTRSINLRAFHTFLAWAKRAHIIVETPSWSQLLPDRPPKEPTIFTEDELVRLRAAAHEDNPTFGLLVDFIILTGLRIGKVLAMKWEDVTDTRIRYLSKRLNRERAVFVSPEIARVLDAVGRKQAGRVWPWSVVSESNVEARMRRALDRAGIERRGRSFHAIRRTYETALYDAGVDVATIADMMDHSIQVSHDRYRARNLERQRDAQKRVMPELCKTISGNPPLTTVTAKRAITTLSPETRVRRGLRRNSAK